MFESAQENFLCDILGIGFIAQNSRCGSKDHILIPSDEVFKTL